MEIRCAMCGAQVPAADVNLERLLAKCVACNSVFYINAQLGVSESARPPRARLPVPLPAAIRVIDDASHAPALESYRGKSAPTPCVVLERRWFTPTFFGLLFFCIAWDAFLIFWYSHAFSANAPWIMIVFPIAHLAVGVGLTYSTLCGFVNKTRIAVEGGVLTVRHGPLPWLGNRSLATEDLDQLFCEEKVGQRGSRSYALSARLKNGRKIALLKSLPEADQALYIEQLLEDRLGIVDVPVAGELAH